MHGSQWFWWFSSLFPSNSAFVHIKLWWEATCHCCFEAGSCSWDGREMYSTSLSYKTLMLLYVMFGSNHTVSVSSDHVHNLKLSWRHLVSSRLILSHFISSHLVSSHFISSLYHISSSVSQPKNKQIMMCDQCGSNNLVTSSSCVSLSASLYHLSARPASCR